MDDAQYAPIMTLIIFPSTVLRFEAVANLEEYESKN